tara:strand:- start:5328 stop:6062 length:735 start_codon:yes stop_codon:yes gene_type:complete
MSDIFNATEATSPASTQTTGSVEELVGEGKKFATVEDLAKGKQEADTFIEQLKGEMSGLRSDLDQRVSSTALLEEIRKEREAQLQQSADAAQGNTSPQLDQGDITNLVNQTIEQREVQQTATGNILSVDTKMKEMYGEKAQEVMLQKAKASNISVEFLQDIASKSPEAFYNVLGITEQKTPTTPMTTGSISTTGLAATQTTTLGDSWADFEKMRREQPKQYWKPETQQRLFRAKQEQGNTFGNN